MLKITFQSFKGSVRSECMYQIPLTLQGKMMAPQGIVSIDWNFPFHKLWGFFYSPVGWPYFLSHTKAVAVLCETSTIY